MRAMSIVAALAALVSVPSLVLAQTMPPPLAWWDNWDGGDVDFGHTVLVDAAGDIYVLGDTYWSTYRDVLLLKYAPTGQLLWEARYDGPGHSWDTPAGMHLMPGGGVVITASSENAQGADDIVTLRYSQFGGLLWEQRYSHPAGFWDLPSDVDVDALGNVHVTGTTYAGDSFGDIVTLKYAPDGAPLWERLFTGPGSNRDDAFDIEVDAAGNVFVAGEVHSNSPDWRNALLLKYNPSGDLLWTRTHNVPNVGGLDTFHSVACDNLGGAVASGEVTLITGKTDVITIRYDAAGSIVWARQYGGGGQGHDRGLEVLLDRAGAAYVMSESDQGAPTYYDYTVIKYTPAGVQERVFTHSGALSFFDSPSDMAMDVSGNLLVTGIRQNGAGPDFEFMTVKFNAQGRVMWEQRFNPSAGMDTPTSLALAPGGRVYVAGTIQAPGLFDIALLAYQAPLAPPFVTPN